MIMVGSVLFVALVFEWRVRFLIRERFAEARRSEEINLPQDLPPARRATCWVVIYVGLLLLAVAPILGGVFLYRTAPGGLVCAVDEWNLIAILRLLMCIAAIFLFGWITSTNGAYRRFVTRAPFQWTRVKFDVLLQFLLLSSVALIQWFGSATERTPAATDLPYRHIFLVWAPCIVAVIAIAPWWARSRFRTITYQIRQHFQQSLPGKELFIHPTDPALSARSIIYAFIFGPANHILHLLLFPALIAIAVPAESLFWSVPAAFVFSLLLLVWGNMSPRWQELNVYIERWFLRGTPLLISLFVMVIAVLRLVGFDYVSTLLDAIPFGTVFGLVLKNYVVF